MTIIDDGRYPELWSCRRRMLIQEKKQIVWKLSSRKAYQHRFKWISNALRLKETYIKKLAGGGELPLGEKLPDNFEVKDKDGFTWKLTGAIELHRLVVEDLAQLEKRKGEITVEIINSTCSVTRDDGSIYKEVRQTPHPNSPGDATLACLLLQSLGLGTTAAEQGRRSQQGGIKERWSCVHPPLLCSFVWLDWGLEEPPCKWGQAK